MLTNATINELELAVVRLNKEFDDNIFLREVRRTKGNLIRFRLGVHDSRGTGSRVSHTGRRIASACWHAHGRFYELLFEINPSAYIRARDKKITKDEGNWQDSLMGSQSKPLYFSDACDCFTGVGGGQ